MNNLSQIVLILLLITDKTQAANFSFNAEHVLTVCDIYDYNHTKVGEPIHRCNNPSLPDTTTEEFFKVAKEHLFDEKCEDTFNDEPLIRKPTVWDRGIRSMHWFIEEVQKKVNDFGWFVNRGLADVTRFTIIAHRWNWTWFGLAAMFVSLLSVLHGLLTRVGRPKKMVWFIFLRISLSLLFTEALYEAHLYYSHYLGTQNIFMMLWFVLFGLFTLSPWGRNTWLPGIAFLTAIELIVPMFGFVAKMLFNVSLFFGPVPTLIINFGSVLANMLCLTALYLNEKLILVKVLLLPFVRMFQKVFGAAEKNEQMAENIRMEAQTLAEEIFTTIKQPIPTEKNWLENLDSHLTAALESVCKNKARAWHNECWYYVRNQCRKVSTDASWVLWLPSLFYCNTAATAVCPESRKAQDLLDEHCTSNLSALGSAYKKLNETLTRLKEEIVINPIQPKVNSEIMEMTAGFDLFTKEWTWWLRIIISWGASSFGYALILTAVISAVVLLVKYRRNLDFANDHLNGSIVERWPIQLSRREKQKYCFSFKRCVIDHVTTFMRNPARFAGSMKPLRDVSFCFLLAKTAQFLHDQLGKIQFYTPNFGEASFVFNIQGEGFFANVMRSVLGGFSLQSKYCEVADSSQCDSAFIPVSWITWLMLFSLAVSCVAVSFFQANADFIMSRICDLLMRKQAERRAIHCLEQILAERRKRKNVVVAMAKEEMDKPVAKREENHLVLAFFLPRRWYHRFAPDLVLSIWAWMSLGVDSIHCQVCWQDIISARFRCGNILFCDECRLYLKECPCGSEVCRDGLKFDV